MIDAVSGSRGVLGWRHDMRPVAHVAGCRAKQFEEDPILKVSECSTV